MLQREAVAVIVLPLGNIILCLFDLRTTPEEQISERQKQPVAGSDSVTAALPWPDLLLQKGFLWHPELPV